MTGVQTCALPISEIMYPDLYKGLGLKPGDLMTYSSPLVSFGGKMVVPKG